ncbi:MAG: hypothetical protein H6734_22990 [Alphaproteobacteria bacterium]|nr:hypothetical protein [Alphaproteobacteria bacterium]
MPELDSLPNCIRELCSNRTSADSARRFDAALTRRAWPLENGDGEQPHHEPLEWLGDRVLEVVVAKELWRLPYPNPKQLDAARKDLVSEPVLTRIGTDVGVLPHLRVGRGERLQGQVAAGKAISDHVDALLGVAFLSGGIAGVEVLVHLWHSHWPAGLLEHAARPKARVPRCTSTPSRSGGRVCPTTPSTSPARAAKSDPSWPPALYPTGDASRARRGEMRRRPQQSVHSPTW